MYMYMNMNFNMYRNTYNLYSQHGRISAPLRKLRIFK